MLNYIIADEAKLARCLLPQLFTSLNPTESHSLVPWLTSVVLSSSNELLVQRAIAVITSIARKSEWSPLEISPLLASCLRALGAKEDSLAYSTRTVEIHVRRVPLLLRGYAVEKLLSVVAPFVR